MRTLLLASAGAVLVSASCAPREGQPPAAPPALLSGQPPSSPPPSRANPLLEAWAGPYGGVPPFARVKVEDFEPAFQVAMNEKRAEVEAIANDPSPPTFENTLAALEGAGRTMDRVMAVYGVWSATMSDAAFQAVERVMEPKLAAFGDEIVQNPRLFARVEAVYASPERARFTPEQRRLAWKYRMQFVRAGAKLDAPAKERLSAINQRLASLYTTFGQNVLADEEGHAVILEREADLAGLPDSVRAGAAAAAAARGEKGKWAITNTRSSMEPFLTYSTRDDLRKKVFDNYVNRGDNGDAHDNNATIREVLKLRAERATLLGYPTFAHWQIEDSMAKTPERAMALMEEVWKPAVARVHEEVRDMQAIADREGAKRKIAAWDYRYYAEKVRKAKYDLDENEVKPYLQLEKLREGMFWVAGELFDLAFAPADNVETYHPDVRVWDVTRKSTGQHVGLWYFDPYARPGKRSGAWAEAYRKQERFRGEVTTIVSNNANFVKGGPGEPVLISWEDARTLFHEFGHALNGLCSDVTYPSLSGSADARDYVEFPSQLLEHWVSTPEVLNRFALHVETGKPMPKELVAKIAKAATFNQGFATVEYLASALVDMKLHLAGARDIDPDAFEKETLASLGMPEEIVMRHRTPQFSHIFSGDGYAAGYYGYLWSDTLSSDAYEAFTEAGGPYDRTVAERLRKYVFAAGDSLDADEAYRAFRGRDAGTGALLRKRGFAKAGTKKGS